MARKTKSVILIMVLLFSFSTYSLNVSAESEEITPFFNNTDRASISFSISESGTATITLNCTGKSGVTTKIVAYSYIEMQIGSSWVRISNGQSNSQWTDTVTDGYRLSTSHSMQLTSSGTYKAVTLYYVYGSGGDTDIISRSVTKTYSKS